MSLETLSPIPTDYDDPINTKILSVSEDLVNGFQRNPFQHIADKSGVDLGTVLTRIRAMLEAGVIRRVRQTLLATKLAHGALCAWKVDNDKLDATFDFMFREDPFSGHVVTRSTDREISGSDYKLWTTLKVPQGESLEEHAELLRREHALARVQRRKQEVEEACNNAAQPIDGCLPGEFAEGAHRGAGSGIPNFSSSV